METIRWRSLRKFDSEGWLIPTMITYENGNKYEIDRVTDICQASAMKAEARATDTR